MTFPTAGDSIDRMASYCRVEQSLFGLFGGWVPKVTDPAAKLALLTATDHCAWRSRRWYEMLPTAPPGPDALLTPTRLERDAFDRIAARVGDGQASRVSLAFGVLLPTLRDAMRVHLDITTAVADGPVRRLLRIAITDIGEDLDAASAAVATVLADPQARAEADRAEAELASSETSFGRIFGA